MLTKCTSSSRAVMPPMMASNFVSILKKIATEHKTVYAWGMFGSVITKGVVEGKAKQYPSWYTSGKVKTVFAPLYGASPAVWGFDCVGLVKGVLWGWNPHGRLADLCCRLSPPAAGSR